MVECARSIMIFVDIITFLLGITILALSIYVVVAYSFFSPIVSLNTVYISMGVGGVLMLVACLGCVASQRGHKGLLCCYLFIVTAALAAQIASVVLVSRYAGQLNSQGPALSGQITDEFDRTLNNAILSTYVSCCVGCPAEQNCTNAQTYFNVTLTPFCTVNSTRVCDPVPTCGIDPNQQACFKTPGAAIPPVSIDKGLCDTFQKFTNGSGVAIVGPQPTGACGGGSPAGYMASMVAYFNGVFYWFIVGFGILCGIQALNLLAAIFVLCCTTDRPK